MLNGKINVPCRVVSVADNDGSRLTICNLSDVLLSTRGHSNMGPVTQEHDRQESKTAGKRVVRSGLVNCGTCPHFSLNNQNKELPTLCG